MLPISIRIKNKNAPDNVHLGVAEEVSKPGATRDAFWQPFLSERKALSAYTAGMQPPDETEIPQRERRLEEDIAKHLRRSLIEYAKETSGALSAASKKGKQPDTRSQASRVLFSVHVSSYSSLNLDLIVGGLDSLNKIFGGDFSLFHVFLDHYLPAAFAAATSPAFAGMMTYDINVPADIQSATSQTPGDAGGGPSAIAAAAQQNAQWIWILSNTSLIIPLGLAMGVLYIGSREVHSLRTEQETAISAEQVQQTALLNSVADSQLQLLKKVSDQQVDSLKDERAQWTALQNFEQQYIVEQLKAKGGPVPSTSVAGPRTKTRRTH